MEKPEYLPDHFWDISTNQPKLQSMIKSLNDTRTALNTSRNELNELQQSRNIPEYDQSFLPEGIKMSSDVASKLRASGVGQESLQLAFGDVLGQFQDVVGKTLANANLQILGATWGLTDEKAINDRLAEVQKAAAAAFGDDIAKSMMQNPTAVLNVEQKLGKSTSNSQASNYGGKPAGGSNNVDYDTGTLRDQRLKRIADPEYRQNSARGQQLREEVRNLAEQESAK